MSTAQYKNSKSTARQFEAAAARPTKRPAPFSLRLTSEERAQLEILADGLPLGSYVKSALFEQAPSFLMRRATRNIEDDKALAQALSLLGQSRIASNLNQLAKAAHLGTLPLGDRVERDLEEACAHIAAIKACLVDALGLKGRR